MRGYGRHARTGTGVLGVPPAGTTWDASQKQSAGISKLIIVESAPPHSHRLKAQQCHTVAKLRAQVVLPPPDPALRLLPPRAIEDGNNASDKKKHHR
jgi:hypothetical protein